MPHTLLRKLTTCVTQLPPGFAIVSAATTITTVAISSSVTPASSATVTTAAAIATTATAIVATAAAGSAISSRARFVDRQIATLEVFPIELFDGRRSLFGRGHFHKTKTSGTSGHAVLDHLRRFNIAGLREMISQIIAGRLEGEVSDIEFCSHGSFYP